MSVLEKLTEGIVNRNLAREGAAVLTKWERTGLLEGLADDRKKQNMAVLLENQAKELLREASVMNAGDVEGFAAVAFPIVRRVFGGLIANDLVSVQPMSLPSGLIFFMDFVHGTSRGQYTAKDSLYGGGVVGSQLTGGVKIDGDYKALISGDSLNEGETGFYGLNNGYASPLSSSVAITCGPPVYGGTTFNASMMIPVTDGENSLTNFVFNWAAQGDPGIASGSYVWLMSASVPTGLNRENLSAISGVLANTSIGMSGSHLVRRCTKISTFGGTAEHLLFVFANNATLTSPLAATTEDNLVLTTTYPLVDTFSAANATGAVVGATPWGLENNSSIPEIDLKVDSIAVTAVTKKLKAKWSPELGQDLNAYHNLDAEVELTSILSEQIALEIDQEILQDLVKDATTIRFWSRMPAKFLNPTNGQDITNNGANLPDFTGTVSEWYEGLIETINDVSAQIHRKTLRGGANFCVCSPEVANILEFTAGFRASVSHGEDRGDIGAVKVGGLNKKFDVYVDPYFYRNVVLVGRKGGSFLESGYVYAPYVPLQTTPTIFGEDDFTPRKGVMTRYAKKMVQPDMYGIVVVQDLVATTA